MRHRRAYAQPACLLVVRVVPPASVLVLLAAAVAAGLPGAAAQAHEHGTGGVAILSDLGPTGTTYVGALNHFTLVAFGDDDEPDFHADLPLRVTLDGTVVLELDAEAGHDYDGVREVWVAFGSPGRYRVEALEPEGAVAAALEGDVLEGRLATAEASLDARVEGVRGGLVSRRTVALDRPDASGEPRDYVAEVRHLGRIVAAAQLRGPSGPAAFTHAPPGLGLYEARVYAFDATPAASAEPRLPTAAWTQWEAQAGGPPEPGLPATALPPVERNAIVASGAGALRLVATYDPWTRVGPDTVQTLGLLALDASGAAVPDVAFEAQVLGPEGRVLWETSHGHAPAGAWSVASLQSVPGIYTLRVVATSAAGDEAQLDVPWTVTPPVEPESRGLVSIAVDVSGSPVAGSPVELAWQALDMDDQPFAHTDLFVDIVAMEAGSLPVPVLRTKLHTHDDGWFRMAFAPPRPGLYDVRLTPSPLEARPVVLTYYAHQFVVAGSGDAPGTAPPPTASNAALVPGFPAALAGLALVAVAAASARLGPRRP
jgi:hypothetical protein